MNDLASPNRRPLSPSTPPRDRAIAADLQGVHGWLLVLCVMLTLVGPLIATALLAIEYRQLAPHFAESPGLRLETLISIAITACSVAFGICAGLRLWSVKPRAVEFAKASLLVGLAAEVVTAGLHAAGATGSPAPGLLSFEALANLVPSFVFFTACFGYLNKSARVAATFGTR